jgi:hypothetical protein
MPAHVKCRMCVRLARPGEVFCSQACEQAHVHEHETCGNHLPVDEDRPPGNALWVSGRKLPLQNSA